MKYQKCCKTLCVATLSLALTGIFAPAAMAAPAASEASLQNCVATVEVNETVNHPLPAVERMRGHYDSFTLPVTTSTGEALEWVITGVGTTGAALTIVNGVNEVTFAGGGTVELCARVLTGVNAGEIHGPFAVDVVYWPEILTVGEVLPLPLLSSWEQAYNWRHDASVSSTGLVVDSSGATRNRYGVGSAIAHLPRLFTASADGRTTIHMQSRVESFNPWRDWRTIEVRHGITLQESILAGTTITLPSVNDFDVPFDWTVVEGPGVLEGLELTALEPGVIRLSATFWFNQQFASVPLEIIVLEDEEIDYNDRDHDETDPTKPGDDDEYITKPGDGDEDPVKPGDGDEVTDPGDDDYIGEPGDDDTVDPADPGDEPGEPGDDDGTEPGEPGDNDPIDTPPALVTVTPAAWVEQLSGNQNRLFVTVTEVFDDGSQVLTFESFLIRNNDAVTVEVAGHHVFVNTQGNTQIRELRLVP